MTQPKERLPDSAPIPLFFLPNFLGIAFALTAEKLVVEQRLSAVLSENAHPYCLLGLGFFALANVNSYLGGSVVVARIKYGVKFPNLYAIKSDGDDKGNAVLFNCIQRGHQNFLENYAYVVLSVLFTALVADRPNTAGAMLLTISACRVPYAVRYRTDIESRTGPFVLAAFVTSIGVGYGALVGLSAFGIQLLSREAK